jgi:hypothetical protein
MTPVTMMAAPASAISTVRRAVVAVCFMIALVGIAPLRGA